MINRFHLGSLVAWIGVAQPAPRKT